MTTGNPFKDQQQLVAELERLRQENDRLRQENQDLHIALATTAEHGDLIEAELCQTNLKLKTEVVERLRAEVTLQTLMELIMQQKEDLEVIVQTIMEHGDVLDMQWQHKLTAANHLADHDSLTQIFNRRRFDEYLDQQWHQMARSCLPLSVILCDIDHFKEYNDAYGHMEGDNCLKQVVQALNQTLGRSTDLLARFGGEEFAAVLPQTPLEGSLIVAEQLRSSVQQLQIPHPRSATHSVVTISLGVTCIIPPAVAPMQLVEEADRLLYLAKQQGRNRVAYAASFAPSC